LNFRVVQLLYSEISSWGWRLAPIKKKFYGFSGAGSAADGATAPGW